MYRGKIIFVHNNILWDGPQISKERFMLKQLYPIMSKTCKQPFKHKVLTSALKK